MLEVISLLLFGLTMNIDVFGYFIVCSYFPSMDESWRSLLSQRMV